MFRNLFSLALQSTLRKKRSSILVFVVLLLSFSCAIMSLSVTESMHYTNAEYRYTTFGEWYIALPYTKEGDRAWVEAQSWTKEIGTATVYGELALSGVSRSFGTADSSYFSLGRITFLEGRMPRREDEVAVTEEVLSALEALCGSTLSPGDKLPIPGKMNGDSGASEAAARYYTLCGVIEDYGKLWDLRFHVKGEPILGAVMTTDGAQALQNAAGGGTPTEQLFLRVDRGERLDAARQAQTYLSETRVAGEEDVRPCVNSVAYPSQNEAVASDEVYALLIAAVALVAVLCVYLMQLPAEVHSFSVLRSVGITKGQMLIMMLLESLLLALPAVLLGIPLGAGLTWLALRLLIYSGSVAVQVAVPYSMLKTLFVLWLAAILLARLVIFIVTVHTPLTGRMQQRRSRRAVLVRRGLIVLLLVGFCAAAAYTAGESLYPTYRIRAFSNWPDYGTINEASTPEFADTLRSVAGVESVEGFMEIQNGNTYASPICISFEGLEERRTNLFMIDERYWQDTIDFGNETEAFHNGDLIYLFFSGSYIAQKPSGAQDPGNYYEWPDCPQPNGDVTVRVCYGKTCLAQTSVASRSLQSEDIKYYSRQTAYGGINYSEPYTVICSEGFIRKLLDEMEPGTEWECFVAGESFAYQQLWITADENAADLSAYYALDTLVRSEFGRKDCFWDQSENKQAEIQTQTQSLILLYACGGCVALVSLLLLASALALEAEQERRSYTILRVIGMSARQMRKKIFGKAFWRSVFAIVAGWAAYAAICIRVQLALNAETLIDAVKNAWELFTYYGGGLPFVATLSAAMLVILLCVSLFAKRGLKQSTLLK